MSSASSSSVSAAAPASDWSAARIAEAAAEIVAGEQLPAIVQAGHPVLRTRAVAFDGQLDAELLGALLTIMRRTMHEAPGVGLAAPQIGLPLRLAVLEDTWAADEEIAHTRSREPLPFVAMVNPAYIPVGDGRAEFFEGCLSVRGYTAVVRRPDRVEARWTAPDGEARAAEFRGWQARIVQHETDHLGGTLYLDKAEARSLCANEEYSARWAQPTPEHAARALGF
ncbi:peptide deformylase [Sinomonas sp. ASV486]|uniref:peptide deformylase n=1 Tax=Sinomonas sp. ASV486 TaxID=3051170 RepID=UPI0027DC2733|nr:peptide deformylase [Sinomonas sp. ASV486]MDQ4491395.1 peptide deformylase [Sinomonas sp. ASV486]